MNWDAILKAVAVKSSLHENERILGKRTLGWVFCEKLRLLARNYICQHCIHSKLQTEPQRGYKETNVVHFSHYYRLNFNKPCDTLFVEVVQLKVV